MSNTEASKIILDFMSKKNRPFAVNDVLENCGKTFGKSTVQKMLDSLAERGKITVKTFGKQNIYFIKQKFNMEENKKELQGSKQKLLQIENNIKNKENEYRELEKKLKVLPKVISIESLEAQHSEMLDEVRELNEKLRRSKAQKLEQKFTSAEAKKIVNHYNELVDALRKRKRICNDMLDAIMEGYPKSKKALIDDIGIETDEAVGFDIKQYK
ncbi:homologous-pairing protein 2 homolog isoform X1 [Teleopsis dalmanni]|uniref:homologous-pairing protein 2 homolog isoform X1 n=1 Tax=Teleopsis dalmanni TaxID=139649 RepID=UPI0018CD6566|nr:homologous-pairing protein 2 homolog isoform X1 [Teleopsis dalmanni]